jgi:hypothetical protein
MPERRAMMQAWADMIDEISKSRADKGTRAA